MFKTGDKVMLSGAILQYTSDRNFYGLDPLEIYIICECEPGEQIIEVVSIKNSGYKKKKLTYTRFHQDWFEIFNLLTIVKRRFQLKINEK